MSPERFQTIKQTLERRQPDLQLFLDEVHKPHNIAAVIRTADAVGMSTINAWTPKGRLRMPKLAAGGSRPWVNLKFHPCRETMIAEAKAEGMQVVVAHLSDQAVDYREIDYTKPTLICMGSEKRGASTEIADNADQHVVIPMVGMVESLNVSVAAAVIMVEAMNQRHKAGLYDKRKISDADYERLLFEWSQPVVTRYCKKNNLPYPPLDEDGDIAKSDLTGNSFSGGYADHISD
jgi:tRNA (guanosine-2'-O-)-methyltransferase